MSDVPERITARYYASGIINARRAGEGWAFSLGNALGQAEYIVIDLSDALIAAAYEAAAGVLDRHESAPMTPNEAWSDEIQEYYVAAQIDASMSWQPTIRALTPADAQAALDARDARIRAEERERCAKVAEGLKSGDFWERRIAAAIRAMEDE